ncbi:hypothetical protein IOC61_04545 [Halomonas sp. KAO]|uniref:hypothetical protein n=1 Tax=Halomonas sp. KAO TaxID=2783858 RepID=UPI0018A06AF5|nr:hypothetical protein [Halomonas sp. KAO]MBF7052583.1 hypothetical protein [Halomonas sp. KAO]
MSSRHTIAALLAGLALGTSLAAVGAEKGSLAEEVVRQVDPHNPAYSPAYASQPDNLMRLENGVVIDGQDIESPDGYTSGFRLIAGFSPFRLPKLDLGAEFSYHQRDEMPTRLDNQQLLVNTVSLGGSLVAGVRLGDFGLYAKSGLVGWEGDAVIPRGEGEETGTTRVRGFGARLQLPGFTSRLELEEYDAPDMAHLNLLTASLHIPF